MLTVSGTCSSIGLATIGVVAQETWTETSGDVVDPAAAGVEAPETRARTADNVIGAAAAEHTRVCPFPHDCLVVGASGSQDALLRRIRQKSRGEIHLKMCNIHSNFSKNIHFCCFP